MSKEEILKNCTWDSYDMATLDVNIPILSTNVKIDFLPPLKSGRTLTDDMVLALNSVIKLDVSQLDIIKSYLFWHFNLCCEATYYGFDIDFAEGESNSDANKRYFDIKNEDDAWKKSKLECLIIDEHEGTTVTFQFEVPWEDEHGCEIEFINGKIVNYENNN
ncbi:hypothetical protein K5I29_02980 [Flavobacterium agricola]|uniref:DUF6985 domain-containing protein n=1 Tax=Flavobacterium agricola TaxID=2870839 RepID=A0ABY6M018_9FLAO|nr:hypothetical protein [Flavobacterium agricola]UYW01895.1 hypothetical protein K5I29_02980 [Flavobacterium agricola]